MRGDPLVAALGHDVGGAELAGELLPLLVPLPLRRDVRLLRAVQLQRLEVRFQGACRGSTTGRHVRRAMVLSFGQFFGIPPLTAVIKH